MGLDEDSDDYGSENNNVEADGLPGFQSGVTFIKSK